jgi:hypothetical protein
MPKLAERDTNVLSSEDSAPAGSDSDEDDSSAGFVSASQYDPGPVSSTGLHCERSLIRQTPKMVKKVRYSHCSNSPQDKEPADIDLGRASKERQAGCAQKVDPL